MVIFFFLPKELGVIGPNNQLPKRRAGQVRGGLHSHLNDHEENGWTNDVPTPRADTSPSPMEDVSNVSEALSLFPQPKSLLTRVIQVATSSSRIRVGQSLGFFTLRPYHLFHIHAPGCCFFSVGADAFQNNRGKTKKV